MINQKPVALTIDNEEAAQEFFKRMNAVALGVEAKYDALTGYSRMVTETTIQMAWQLGIPEKEIQQWEATRAMLHSERNRAITSLLIN